MKLKILSGMLLIGFSCIFNLTIAQNFRKKIEQSYRFATDNDSFIQHSKIFEYDNIQRLIKGEEQYFSVQANRVLSKEILTNFDSAKMILTEKIFKYDKDKTESERLRTKYLIYTADERKNKYLCRQYFDNMDEMMKEDTLVYDKNYNLLSRCEFDYRGSTSHYCDVYNYNKKNQLKRWRMYVYWTTVNMASKPVTQKAKRQDYKYVYNAKGQPLSSRGKRYSTFFKEKYSYDEAGKMATFTQQKIRLVKPSKKKNKGQESTEKAKVIKNIDLVVREYKNGKSILEQQISNNIENQRVESIYINDTLIVSQVIFSKGIKIKEIDYEYGSMNQLSAKIIKNFDDKGNIRNTIKSAYNSKGQLEGEFNYIKDALVSENLFAYDPSGNTISVVQYLKTKSGTFRKYEATYFSYE